MEVSGGLQSEDVEFARRFGGCSFFWEIVLSKARMCRLRDVLEVFL